MKYYCIEHKQSVRRRKQAVIETETKKIDKVKGIQTDKEEDRKTDRDRHTVTVSE